MGKLKYRRGIFLVVYSKSKPERKIKYLILKRRLHWRGWEFPKGGIERREPIKKAIIREAVEETGFKPLKGRIKKFDIKGKYLYDKIYPDRLGFKGQNYVLYSAEIKHEKIRLDNLEHSGYKWVDFRTAVKMLTWKNQKKCLRIVNSWIKHEI